jgi:hypothetical protein
VLYRLKSRVASGGYVLSRTLLFLLISGNLNAEKVETPEIMKIRITVGEKRATATLDNSDIARDFYSMLPMIVELEDYASTEKITYPERKLNTSGSPEGYDPSAGDITYYAPWGNLALFYKDFSYSKGLIRLGEFDDGGAILKFRGTANARFEVAP